MNKAFDTYRRPSGFTLAEVLAALMISAMVLTSVLSIYHRAEKSAAGIKRKLDDSRLPTEVLQRIAEDLDRIIASGSDTTIAIANKFDNGYPTAKLTILRTIYDGSNRTQTFEEIIWQSYYDYESDAGGLVLYRSYNGVGLEDKLLDEQREDLEKQYPFVPICTGVTFFSIQVPVGEKFQDSWTSPILPQGITVTISFAEPFKTVSGPLDVLEEEKITRTIAVDRSRKIRFKIVPREKEVIEKEDENTVEEDASTSGEGEDTGKDDEGTGEAEIPISDLDKEVEKIKRK